MRILADGTFQLGKGENFPYICPKDNWPIPFDDTVTAVRCPQCGYTGAPTEFQRSGFRMISPEHRACRLFGHKASPQLIEDKLLIVCERCRDII